MRTYEKASSDCIFLFTILCGASFAATFTPCNETFTCVLRYERGFTFSLIVNKSKDTQLSIPVVDIKYNEHGDYNGSTEIPDFIIKSEYPVTA